MTEDESHTEKQLPIRSEGRSISTVGRAGTGRAHRRGGAVRTGGVDVQVAAMFKICVAVTGTSRVMHRSFVQGLSIVLAPTNYCTLYVVLPFLMDLFRSCLQ